MALRDRVSRAKASSQFADISKDSVQVPGHQGRRYTVRLISGGKGNTASFTWTKCCQVGGGDCPGNSNGYICYHTIAAILAVAGVKKARVRFCRTWDDAERLARLGGRIAEFASQQGTGRLWAVVKEGGK